MPTRWENVVVDARAPRALGHWWAEALSWSVTAESADEVDVAPPDRTFDLVFAPVADAKVGKNRVHLDLRTGSAAEQRDLVARLRAAGATPADIGQGATPWTVLADPEGNEFCVLDPRDAYADTGSVAAVVIDAADPAVLAAFWAEATGWPVVSADIPAVRDPGGGPWLEFIRTEMPRTVKNRVHLDVLAGPDDERDEQVARLVTYGARGLDLGHGDLPWTVLADPEGNEFCLLPPRRHTGGPGPS